MNKKTMSIAIGVLVLAGLACSAAPAFASTEPSPSPAVTAPAFRVGAWEMPSWIDSTTPTWSQTLALSSASIPAVNLAYFDTALADVKYCGKQFQVDVYKDDATTTALFAGGVLSGPNNPAESFPSPNGWGTSYKLVKTADCPPPVIPKVTWLPASQTCNTYTLPALDATTQKYPLADINDQNSRFTAGTHPLSGTVSVVAHTIASANVVQESHTYTFTASTCPPAKTSTPDTLAFTGQSKAEAQAVKQYYETGYVGMGALFVVGLALLFFGLYRRTKAKREENK